MQRGLLWTALVVTISWACSFWLAAWWITAMQPATGLVDHFWEAGAWAVQGGSMIGICSALSLLCARTRRWRVIGVLLTQIVGYFLLFCFLLEYHHELAT